MRIITIALFVFVFLLTSAGTLFAQDNYYWSGGEKIALDQDRSTAVLIYEDAAATQGQALTTQGLPWGAGVRVRRWEAGRSPIRPSTVWHARHGAP